MSTCPYQNIDDEETTEQLPMVTKHTRSLLVNEAFAGIREAERLFQSGNFPAAELVISIATAKAAVANAYGGNDE